MTEIDQINQAIDEGTGPLLAVAETSTKLAVVIFESSGKSDLETKEKLQKLGIECAFAMDSAAAHLENIASKIRDAVKGLI